MNPHLQKISDLLAKNASLSEGDKKRLLKEFEKTDATWHQKEALIASQTRELQIEAALEKVRSRSMGMHKSGELREVVAVIYEQMKPLGFATLGCELIICDDKTKELQYWSSTPEQTVLPQCYTIPRSIHPFFKKAWEAWKKQTPRFVFALKGMEKRNFDNLIFEKTAFKHMPEKVKAWIRAGKIDVFSIVTTKYGLLEAVDRAPLSEEKFRILERFAKVFEQTYTRFLDLQKAEAQTREAQIEVALERVRTRAMAMHKGEELADTSMILFEQVTALGIKPRSCGFLVMDEESKSMDDWSANLDQDGKATIVNGKIDFDQHPMISKVVDAWRRGDPYFIGEIHGQQLQEYYDAVTAKEAISKEIKDKVLAVTQSEFTNSFYFEFGMLYVLTDTPLNDNEINIILRFAGILKLTYRRFLDLQKAEAQAREAQIEAALERVRASTLAMHKSQDLAETALVLYDQFTLLGNNPDRMSIGIFTEETKEVALWPTDQTGGGLYQRFTGSWERSEVMTKMYKAWKAGNDSQVVDLSGQNLKVWLKFIRDEMKLFVDDTNIKGRRVQQAAFFSHGFLLLTTNDPVPHDTMQLLMRFAGVFSQTYTRFLDLQKAEAQAREAQIEAALERVRSRTMAMQKSEDLIEAAADMFQQTQVLGMKPWACGFNIFNMDEKTVTQYMCPADGSISPPFKTPLTEDPYFKSIHDARQRGDELLVMESKGESLAATYRYMFSLPGSGEIFSHLQKSGFEMPKFQITHCAFFSHGYLMFISYESVAEFYDIFKRFAKVFEQTYTRFLDLQKAEAQAREAQIEAALEKIRAKTMGMRSSDELREVIQIIYEQLIPFISHFDAAGFAMDIRENDDWNLWHADRYISWPHKLHIPYFDHPYFKAIAEAKKNGVQLLTQTQTLEEREKYYEYVWTYFPIPPEAREMLVNAPGFASSMVFLNSVALYIVNYEGVPFSNAENTTLVRFANVFEQTYTRFLDLQKAEAQAREAQIETALERVRSRTMGMHRSEELKDVVKGIFDQLADLGINAEHAGIVVDYEPKKDWHFWIAETQDIPAKVTVPYLDLVWDRQFTEAKKEGKHFFTTQLDFDEKNRFYEVLLPHIEGLTKKARDFYFSCPGLAASTVIEKDIGLYIENFSGTPYSKEENDILKRFAKVFQQTYTRFLDLQKAENQAREAQIEASLERVRASTMAMHKTDELSGVIKIFFRQFELLGLTIDTCVLDIIKEGSNGFNIWIAAGTETYPEQVHVPFLKHPMFTRLSSARAKKKEFLVMALDNRSKETFFDHFYKNATHIKVPKKRKDLIAKGVGIHASWALLPHANIGLWNYRGTAYNEEENQILARMGQVFEQTYTRFLDLQKAEAQAREAKIEASLERVRSKTMAMHNSHDVSVTVVTLFDEVSKLGLDDSIRCGIGILEGTERMETWSAKATPDGAVDLKMGLLNMTVHPLLVGVKNAWIGGKKSYSYELKGAEVRRYYQALNAEPDYPFNADLDALPKREFHNSFYFSAGILFAFTENPITEEASSVLKRFAGVFGQTYRRYLDLLKAETQAREAQIEAALERLRSRSMAMQHSSELNLILAKVFEELTLLDLEMERAVIWTYSPEDRSVRWWAANPEAESGTESYFIGDCDDPVYNEYWKAWEERRTKYLYILEGAYKENWTDILFNQTELRRLPEIVKERMAEPEKIYLYNTFNEFGVLFVACLEPLADEKFNVLERFGKVFDQSYTRFNDIKQAELREKEAIKQSSLDRVRGQIASMRSTADLDRITPLVWNELTILGVPFIRCGVFIIDEATQIVKAYLSSPNGASLGVLDLPFAASDLTSDSVTYWKKKKVLHRHWNKEEFVAWTESLMGQGLLKNKATYQGTAEPPESLDLHFIPFDQGMLYVGSETALTVFQIDLVQALANAFSVAYARYEDFAELEKAKESIENTLTELKATQNQLVQSEKMASLGELTAGIAHEIQNPLNFVNNFSEVSKELLEEMMEEIDKGDVEEVKAIAEDVIQNLQKIVHHGKRADGIVKGMLQHSRSSDGQKEPTDINALADEYVRLAYHGLRAKDKSFNATLKTDFDPGIKTVSVIPQELGRVILNLLTNAFYAVNERSIQAKASKNGAYEPTVSIATTMGHGQVVISVGDNGNGIPQKVLDKIFQPFFTTKPTGQGTGLGLSMSYDIITKGHGGDLKVDTKEGEGTKFSISIPMNSNG